MANMVGLVYDGGAMDGRSTLASLLTLVALACGPAIPKYDYSKEPDPRRQEYVIGPADVLEVNVWNNSNISRASLPVRPDGTITLPLIGDIQAAGRTPTELKDEVKRRLAEFLKDEAANVQVGVVQANSYRFTCQGNVEAPGVYPSPDYVRIATAIALCGGINRYGNSERITIERQDRKGEVRRIPINLKLITSGKRPDMNIYIMPGDTILIP
jgi:polysaccharide export outer membrane protein